MSSATSLELSTSRPLGGYSLPAPRRVGGLPILGVLPALLRDGPGFLLSTARAHPDELFSIQLGPVQVPVVYRPDDLQRVLIDDARTYSKGGMWSATRPLLGNGLVTSDGEVWRRQRQLMQPLFTPKHLASLSGLMVDAIRGAVDRMAERAGQPMEIGQEMTLITQRVLFETMFGTSLDPAQAEGLGRQLNVAFQAMNIRIFTYFLPEWFPRPGGRAFKRALGTIDAALMRMVAERRAQPAGRPDLLSLLLAARDPDTGDVLSDREVRDQLVTLFVAGLDTTAVTLTWLMHLLDEHPEVDERLRAEVAEVIGDRAPTALDLPQLQYTRRVLQEAMRLYPPAWIFPRYAADGAEVGGRRIAAGTSLLVSPWLAHRDPRHWERPDSFDPDHFLPERVAARPKLAYVPFGAGGRACIGNHFAMMEGTLATVLLVQRFRAERLPGQKIVPAAASTLKPKGGLHMKLRLIDGPTA